MTRIFYAKIKLYNSDKNIGNTKISLKTFGYDEEEAEENVSRLVEMWDNVEEYEIEKISPYQIVINPYVVIVTLKYRNGKAKTIRYNTRAENEKEAEEFFREQVSNWKNVISFQVHKVDKRTQNKR